MPRSIRTSVLLVVLLTSALPIGATLWFTVDAAAELAESERAAVAENEALAAAVRAEAAASSGGDPLRAAAVDGANTYFVDAEGGWRSLDGVGADPSLGALLGERLSGTALGRDPATGEEASLAWARAPATDAAVLVARPPPPSAPPRTAVAFAVAGSVAAGALVVAAVLARRIVAPLHRVEAASRRLARGDWDERVPLEGSAEARRLGESFNRMAEDLARQRAELETWARSLDRLARDRAKSLGEAHTDLAALTYTVAHELREPLRSMGTLAKSVGEDSEGDEAALALRMLSSEAERLERVLLDLVRFDEIARRDLQLAPIPLAEPLERALARVERERPGALRATVGALPDAKVDAGLVEEAFVEALRNVAVHAPTAVEVSGKRDGDDVVVTFDDRGAGIPLDRREDAFHLFQRLTREGEGTGVGLAIVRRVTERHDGEASLGGAPGGGARLTIRLPAAGPAPRAPPPAPSVRTF